MHAKTTWLSQPEKSLIVEEAISILEHVGFGMKGSKLLPVLAEAGAQADPHSGLVRFPASMVEEAIAACPREILMAGLSPDQDALLASDSPYHFTPTGCPAKTLDYVTGMRRPSTLDDLRRATAVCDVLPGLDVMWTIVSATDVPSEKRELVEYYTVLTETSKHVTFVDCPSQTETVRSIFEVLAGDLDAFRLRPRISTVITAASPLRVEGRVLDVHAALAECGAPIAVYSMASAGATSPVTLAGTVTQGVAEFLGIATALQAAVPGARLIFCFGSGVLDMRHTTFSLGCLENSMMNAAATEVGHYMGVPTMNPAASTDARAPGMQASFEKALKALATCAVNPDLVSGWGGLDSSNMLYLPQILIDHEIALMVRRMLSEVEITPQTIMADMMERVGVGGDFLKEKETARRVRAGEHFAPAIANRLSYDKWQEQQRSEDQIARDKLEEALALTASREPCLPHDQLEALRRLCGVEGLSPRNA